MPATYSGTSGSGASGAVWRAIVTLNAVDVSSKIVGPIRIEAEEGSARIAELTYRTASGDTFTVAAWSGKSLFIDIADYSTGIATSITRLFTGLVDTPTLDLSALTIGLRCTDNLQNVIEAMDNAAIDAAIPTGYASPVIFDPATRGWSRAQDRLSTVAKSLELSPAAALRLTDWSPKTTPDISFTDSHILDDSLAISFSSRNQLNNQVDIDFGYRFPRLKAEEHAVTFSYVDETSIASYVSANNWFLQRAAVEAAIKAAGGTIVSISYTALPTAAIGPWIPGPFDGELCMGFTAGVSFDFAQTTEERYAITVNAPNSITAVGTLKSRLSGALVGEYPPILAVENNIILFKNDISGIPPADLATPISGHTNSAEVTLTTATDRSAANAATQALIAVAKVRIWASHRQNSVSAAVPLNPSIDLSETIDINVTGVHAKGKCQRVTHRFDADSGEAVSEFSLAICSVAGTGVTHSETATSAPAGSALTNTTLSGSTTVVFNGGPTADHKITITFPAVASGERDARIVNLSSTYLAPLTEDVFTITL